MDRTFTLDDGLTWELIEQAPITGLLKFHDNETGWVVRSVNYEGYTPVIYKWDGEPFPELMVDTIESKAVSSINVFPNPFQDYLTIDFDNPNHEKVTIDLLNIKGQLIKSAATASTSYTMNDLTKLASGTYLLRVIVGNKLHTLRIVKR